MDEQDECAAGVAGRELSPGEGGLGRELVPGSLPGMRPRPLWRPSPCREPPMSDLAPVCEPAGVPAPTQEPSEAAQSDPHARGDSAPRLVGERMRASRSPFALLNIGQCRERAFSLEE
ncbi:hypothetical protein NDU88_006842 [Pleurodeles waltl]|uniref:Uncharacterized protein n=1 Tax=Pleurodeles waltl TaxID=8319 RepID=A0AAV7N0L4_PLEWA|nr:hypothetical protein NDU88_006842 [Pleurodeles waltl]